VDDSSRENKFMTGRTYELHGVRVFECAAEGPPPRNDRDAVELIGQAVEHRASVIVIPAERLGGDFFDLKTRIAGEVLQKFVTYGVRVAIAGDISRQVSESAALRDFVYECNRGPHIWFVADAGELGRRLKRGAAE
jgi:hypothetical protein